MKNVVEYTINMKKRTSSFDVWQFYSRFVLRFVLSIHSLPKVLVTLLTIFALPLLLQDGVSKVDDPLHRLDLPTGTLQHHTGGVKISCSNYNLSKPLVCTALTIFNKFSQINNIVNRLPLGTGTVKLPFVFLVLKFLTSLASAQSDLQSRDRLTNLLGDVGAGLRFLYDTVGVGDVFAALNVHWKIFYRKIS